MATHGKPLWILAGITVMACAFLLTVQPYSVASPWRHWDEPARRFLGAAARVDTGALGRLSASPEAVRWAIWAGRTKRDALADWASSARAWTGLHRGDTTDAWYGTLTDACSLRLTFIDEQNPRVIDARASCNFTPYWPLNPALIRVRR
jgi:hypothetical protein